jgi:hypothetical protein
MASDFSKDERLAWEDILEGFNDALVMSRNVTKYTTDSTGMERQGDVIWRPMPYIAQSFSGLDQSSNFYNNTQLSVPATLGYLKSVPWTMDSKELRDMLQEGRLGEAAKIKLASDVNLAVLTVASNQGTLVVTQSAAPSGYDDIADVDAVLNEQGVPMNDRYYAASSRTYNGLASDLAGRQTMGPKVTSAYERSYVGNVAGFETYKMDYANRLTAASGAGDTIDTQAAAGNYYTPVATSVATTGERSNVDNRYQQITVSDTTDVAAGDCATIAGITSCHHITKQSTGQLKTFRVISVDDGTTLTISPPIISNQGGTDAEAQYQNCVVEESGTAAITYLNSVTADINPFWHKDAIELLPGRLAVPSDAGAAVMRGTTDQGIELVWQKQYELKTSVTFYRLDCFFGVVLKQPEMAGIELFAQT